MRLWTLTVIAAATVFTAVGCTDSRTAAANKRLWNENAELTAQLHDANARLAIAPDADAYNALQAQLAERDAKIAELQTSLNSDPGISGVETSYDPRTKTLTVNLPGDVLFPAGRADLKKTAVPTLDKIVAALKSEYSGKKVEVKGHTDSDPIAKSKVNFKDNLELSLERAATVTRYLEGKGVDPKLVKTTGFASNLPKDEKNKSVNRRVEIAVIME